VAYIGGLYPFGGLYMFSFLEKGLQNGGTGPILVATRPFLKKMHPNLWLDGLCYQ
jgi:hypothetical protein